MEGALIALSFDQDWAPSWATEWIASAIADAGVEATFFVTHDCPSLKALRWSGHFELGWHPNFLAGSSHGQNMAEVLGHMKELVPEAVGVRAHCLIRGTPYLQAYKEAGILYDASDLHDGEPNLKVFTSWTGVKRIPIFFEDDVHLARQIPCTLRHIELERPGLKVFNFHPVLLALNAATPESYTGLKESLARSGTPLTQASVDDFSPHIQSERPGVQDLFLEILSFMKSKPDRCAGLLSREIRGKPSLQSRTSS